jgi:hypothetical protein
MSKPNLSREQKYRARATYVDGHRFASQREAHRYQELMLAQKATAITDLVLQPRFALLVGTATIGHYVADFQYRDPKEGVVVEDAKGFQTPLYRWKKRHFEAQYGNKIREVWTVTIALSIMIPVSFVIGVFVGLRVADALTALEEEEA